MTTETYAERMATSSPNRRRQRSVRVSVAVALLAVATLVVLLALPTQSAGWLSLSSVVALLCGFAAARIVYNELVQSRREAATDRAAQAQAYRSMFSERAEEHAEFTTAMTERLATRERDIQELETNIVDAEKRALEAESRVQREARRANEAQERVTELQQALEIRKAEEADELASWDGWEGAQLFDREAEDVVGLLGWEEKVGAAVAADQGPQQQQA
jgi:Skp family chaperone for outer membrane proteins